MPSIYIEQCVQWPKIKQNLKCFQIVMFSVGEQAKADEEVVSLGYKEVGIKLGWVTVKFIAALDIIQPK